MKTQSESPISPLPWWMDEVNDARGKSWAIYAPDNSAYGSEGDLDIVADYLTKANAAEIVRRVNCHDAAIEAMSAAVAHIENGRPEKAREVLEAGLALAQGGKGEERWTSTQ